MAKGNYDWNQITAPSFSGSNAAMANVGKHFDRAVGAAENALGEFKDMESRQTDLANLEGRGELQSAQLQDRLAQRESDEYVDSFMRQKREEINQMPLPAAEKQAVWNNVIKDFRGSHNNAQEYLDARGKKVGYDKIHGSYADSFDALAGGTGRPQGQSTTPGGTSQGAGSTSPADAVLNSGGGESTPAGGSVLDEWALMSSPVPDNVRPGEGNYGNILHSPDGKERFAEIPEGGTIADARRASINPETGRNAALGYFQIQLHQMPEQRMAELQNELGLDDSDEWNYENQEKIAKSIFMENARAGKNMGNIFLGLSKKDEDGNPTGMPTDEVVEEFPFLRGSKELTPDNIYKAMVNKDGYDMPAEEKRKDYRIQKFFDEVTPTLIASEGGPKALEESRSILENRGADSSAVTARQMREARDNVARLDLSNTTPENFMRSHRLAENTVDQLVSQKSVGVIQNYDELARSTKNRSSAVSSLIESNPFFQDAGPNDVADLVDIVQKRLRDKGRPENYAVVEELVNRAASDNWLNTTRGGTFNKFYGKHGVKDAEVSNAIDNLVDGHLNVDRAELQRLEDLKTAMNVHGENAARFVQNRDTAQANLETYARRLGVPVESLENEPRYQQYMAEGERSLNLYKNAVEQVFNMESPNSSSYKNPDLGQGGGTGVDAEDDSKESLVPTTGELVDAFAQPFPVRGAAELVANTGRKAASNLYNDSQVSNAPNEQDTSNELIQTSRPNRTTKSQPKQPAKDPRRLLNSDDTKNEVMNTFRGVSEEEYDNAVRSLLRKEGRSKLSSKTNKETIDALLEEIEKSIRG